MSVKVITPPTQQIPTAELRAQCRITGTAEDSLLVGYLEAAVGYAQHYTGRSIGQQTLELALDEWPDGAVELPRGPVLEVKSVKYIDADGNQQTMSSSLWALDDYDDQRSWLVRAVDTEWPALRSAANVIKVQYDAGSVPGAVRQALLMLVAHMYSQRETSAPSAVYTVPLGVTDMLNTVRVWGV
jgi:uncharacterized phiE125 gp8 family phage protein